MKKKVLVIGEDAYLAQGIQNSLFGYEVDSIKRAEPEKNCDIFKNYDIIINFTIQPEFYQQDLSTHEFIDVQIAKCLIASNTKLIVLSSRKVYGSHKNADIIQETDNLDPDGAYARNKVKVEQAVRMILPNQHLILRIANILGEPVNRLGYKTFMGWISESMLTKGKLTVTENRKTKKDFVTRHYLQQAIFALIEKDVNGTFNVGSGFAFSLEDLLTKIVGKKQVIFEDKEQPRDQFILNPEKLHQYVRPFTRKELERRCSLNKNILINFLNLQKDRKNGSR